MSTLIEVQASLDQEITALEEWKGNPTMAQIDQAIYLAGYTKRQAADQARPWEILQGRAKAWLARALMVLPDGGTVKTDSGSAWLVAAGETVSYDTAALDALRASSPELDRILSPHRKVVKRAGYVAVKANS